MEVAEWEQHCLAPSYVRIGPLLRAVRSREGILMLVSLTAAGKVPENPLRILRCGLDAHLGFSGDRLVRQTSQGRCC